MIDFIQSQRIIFWSSEASDYHDIINSKSAKYDSPPYFRDQTVTIISYAYSQIKGYAIGICCFAAKHEALKLKSEDWYVRNEDNVSEWCDMSNRGLLF
jgi:hypothetical protein